MKLQTSFMGSLRIERHRPCVPSTRRDNVGKTAAAAASMRASLLVRRAACGAVAVGLALQLGVALAEELQVREAKALATVPGQPVGAAYMVLSSKEDTDLISMSSDAAARVELHRMDKQGDISRMRRVETLALTAGKAVRLGPGGLHLMLIELSHPLQTGQQINIEFVTEDGKGRQTVTNVVVPVVKEVPR